MELCNNCGREELTDTTAEVGEEVCICYYPNNFQYQLLYLSDNPRD